MYKAYVYTCRAAVRKAKGGARMSNNYIKTLVTQMRDVLGRKIGLIDSTRYIVSPSVPREIDANINDIWDACMRPDALYRFAGYTFVSFGREKCEYIAFALGEDDEAERSCRILGTAVSGIKAVYDDKFDKGNFIKNVLLDNVLPGDIFAKARELNLMNETKRTVFDISKKDLSVNEFNAREIVERIFPDTAKDFVITIDSGNIVLVKEIPEDEEYNPEETAKSIVNTLESEAMISVMVGIGTPVYGIRELAKSYKEAQIAIEIGQVFDEDKRIIDYSNLGIARLIYQLPTTLCELFLSEVFK